MAYLKSMSEQLSTVLAAYDADIKNAEANKKAELVKRLKLEKAKFLKMNQTLKVEMESLAPLSPKHKSLVELTPTSRSVAHFSLMKNQAPGKAKIFIGDTECHEFLFAHAKSQIIYDIPAGAKRFQAKATSPHSKSVIFEIYIDGDRKFNSKPLSKYKEGYINIDIPLSDKNKSIELFVNPLENDNSDWTVWCTPRFILE